MYSAIFFFFLLNFCYSRLFPEFSGNSKIYDIYIMLKIGTILCGMQCEGNSYEKKLKLLKKIARTFTLVNYYFPITNVELEKKKSCCMYQGTNFVIAKQLSREKSRRNRKPSAKWIAVQSSFKNVEYSPKLPMDSGNQNDFSISFSNSILVFFHSIM